MILVETSHKSYAFNLKLACEVLLNKDLFMNIEYNKVELL